MDKIGLKTFFDKRVVVSAIAAGLLLVVTNSAIWANNYIFNTEKFTTTAVTSVTSDSSRQAIASAVTTSALGNYPAIENLVQDPLNNLISGLLGTDQAHNLLTRAVTRLQVVLTSNQRQVVAIDLRGIKSTLTTLLQITGRTQTSKIQPGNFPDQLVIFNPKGLPSFYPYEVALTWIAPLTGIVALILLALPYIRRKGPYMAILITQGVTVALAGLLALLVGPLFLPIVQGSVNDPNIRVVVDNLYNAFIATFDSQSMELVALGFGVAIIGVLIVFARLYLPQVVEGHHK